jgi:hypothetical protein
MKSWRSCLFNIFLYQKRKADKIVCPEEKIEDITAWLENVYHGSLKENVEDIVFIE